MSEEPKRFQFTIGRMMRATTWPLVAVLLTVTSSALAAPTVRQNFTATTQDILFGGYPPDTNGTVGNDYFVEFINGTYAVFNKSNHAEATNISDVEFWTDAGVDLSTASAVSDPRIIYDPANRRWFATMIDVTVDEFTGEVQPNNHLLLAVSATSNPTGAWHGFTMQPDPSGTRLADFPRMGLDANGVYLATDNFQISPEELQTVTVVSIPKADLVKATPTIANRTMFANQDPNVVGFALQPVVDFGPSVGRGALLAVDNIDFGKLDRTTVLGAGGSGATLSATTGITVPQTSSPPPGKQPDGAAGLETNDDRISAHVMKVGDSLWAAQNIGFPIGHQPRAAIRWYQLNETTNTLIQPAGTIGDSTHDYIYPSIAANQFGDVVVGFTRTSTSEYPSAYAVVGSTNAGTGVTTFGAPILLKAGEASFDAEPLGSPNRWGDYSATQVDPADPFIFWTIQEFAGTPEDFLGLSIPVWGTQVSEIIIPHAGEARWKDPLSGTFGDGTKWLAGVAPLSTDHAIFSVATTPNTSGYTVMLDSDVTNDRMSVRQGHVTFDLAGHTYTLTNTSTASPGIIIGEFGGTPQVTLIGAGTLTSTNASIAAATTADAVVHVDAAIWNNSGSLQVGSSTPGGNGTLSVGAAGAVHIGDLLAVWSGGTVEVDGGALSALHIENRGSFNHTSGSLLVGNSFINQAGVANIVGSQSWSPGSSLVVNGGTVTLGSDAGASGVTLAASVNAGGTLQLDATQHINSLAISGGAAQLTPGGAKILVTDALSATGGGTLDVADHAVVVKAAANAGPATLAAITNLVASGFSAAQWNGAGINSSVAAGDGDHLTAVGVMLNSNAQGNAIYANFAGEPVDANSVLLRFTYTGDANLDGLVDGSDYALIDNGFNLALTGWHNGDFNYTGAIDGTDYAFIDNAFNFQGAPLAAGGFPLGVSSLQAVPEPGSVVLIAIGAAMILIRTAVRRAGQRSLYPTGDIDGSST